MPNKNIMDGEGFDVEIGIDKRRKKDLGKYIKESLAKGYTAGAIKTALVKYGFEEFFADRLIRRYKSRDVLLKSVFLITIVLLVSSLLLLRLPRPIGLAPLPPEITQVSYDYSDEVNLIINGSYEYVWEPANIGNLTSVRLSGAVSKRGEFEAYLEHDDLSYLIFDSSGLSYSDEGLEREPILMGTQEKARIALDGVFEFDAVNEFEQDVDYSKVCSMWNVNNVSLCYGSGECCAFIELESLGEWNDTLYLSYGRYNSSLENVVSAQLIYYDVNLSVPYSNIVLSDVQEIEAEFYETRIEFSDVCVESCLLPGFNASEYSLIFIVRDGSLQIDSIGYTIEREIEISDTAPSLVKDFENITIYKDYDYWFELSSYFYDEDEDELSYSISDVEDISVFIRESRVQIVPDYGFTGRRYMYFTASDGTYDASSNVFFVNVIGRPLLLEEVEVSEELVKPRVVINQPVRWVKKVNVSAPVINLSVDISSDALNVSVRDVKEDKRIREDKLKVNDMGVIKDAAVYRVEKRLEQIDKIEDRLDKRRKELIGVGMIDIEKLTEISIKEIELENERNRLTGYAVVVKEKGLFTRFFEWLFNIDITGYAVVDIENESSNVTSVIIEEIVSEVEVEYYTEGPIAEEEDIADGKRIIISSDVHYEDILAYTYLDDVPESGIKLYRIVNESRELVNDVRYYDENMNGRIDLIEWIIPSLSNATYEVSITVLNVHSYPSLYGNWTVRFDTIGIANLTITATKESNYTENYTRWSELSEDDSLYDLRFLDVRCGDTIVEYSWHGEDCQENECSVFIPDYSCNETGYEISKVLTLKKHVLRFNFGDQEAYAYNAVQNISDCTRIVSSGTYYLNESITNSEEAYCMEIIANDVVLDCQGNTIGGDGDAEYGINIERGSFAYTNVTVRNCIVTNWYDAGIYISNAGGVSLENVDVDYNPESGIYILDSQDTRIIGSRIRNNNRGVFIEDSLGNDILNSYIEHNNIGIYLYSSWDNQIYNNYLNNTGNAGFGGAVYSNIWNIGKTDGANIVNGSYLGGNYWAEPDGMGHSQLCNDTNGDAICDEIYIFAAGNVDYLPLKAPDIIDPVVHLMRPANDSVVNNATQTFSCNITDDNWIANLTLYIWNSIGDVSYRDTTELSGIVNQTNWTHELGNDDNYTWNCLGYDAAGNYNWSEEGNYTITLDRISPVVHLEGPANNSAVNNATQMFSCNITDNYRVANLTLHIWNSSYDLNYMNTTNLSGSVGEADWIYEFNNDDNYTWNCLGYDAAGNYNWSEEGNYTITLDRISPVVHLEGPANNSVVNNATQMFSCNITDNYRVANLTLYIWNSSYDNVLTNTTKLSGMVNRTEWNLTLPYDDTFSWNCLGYDAAGNYNWSEEGNYSITLDRVSPVVHLMNPANDSAVNNETQTFSCNITDDNWIANLTLYIWNSSYDLSYRNTTNLSGMVNRTEWNYTFGNDDNYTWNCLGYDIAGNYNWSEEGNYSITLDRISPVVHLEGPANDSAVNNATQMFSCNITDNYRIANLTLHIWNSSYDLSYRNTTNLSGSVGEADWIYEFNNDDNYTWNCLGYDAAGNYNWSEEGNYSITLDRVNPIVHLEGPANDSVVSNATQMFSCNITDNYKIANLTLYVWNSSYDNVLMNTTELSGMVNRTEWNLTLPYDDTFLWNCLGYDAAGNYNWSEEGNYSITLDRISPVVHLIGNDETTVNEQTQVFACNITDNYDIANLTLYIWNSTGNVSYRNTTNLTGRVNQTNWTYTFGYDDTYSWNCLGYDTAGNYNWSEEGNYSITYMYNLTWCAEIIVPGSYYLVNDIVNGSSKCIDIKADDVSLDCLGNSIGGDDIVRYGIYIYRFSSNYTNITIRNCTVKDWSSRAIYIYGANNVTLENMNVYSNPNRGIYIRRSQNISIINSSVNDNNGDGIYISRSDHNRILNSYISNNSDGIDIYYGSNNTIYNNFFNNTYNFSLRGAIYDNTWNTSKREGVNIVNGTHLGGNYWANLDGTGYSQTCNVTIEDDFCDEPYILAAGNVDYLPLVTPDTIPPDGSHIAAAGGGNGTITNSLVVTFEVNATDNRQLSNITIHIWNSTGYLLFLDTVNVSGRFVEVSWEFTFTYDDAYLWSALIYDKAGNFEWTHNSPSNWTLIIDTTPPIVHLMSPENNTNVTIATQTFACNITDKYGVANLTLYIWNSTSLEYVNTTKLTGRVNQTSWDYTFSNDGNYTWNCQGYDFVGNNDFSVEGNYSIFVDMTAPVVHLISPENNTNTTTAEQMFSCNITDNNGAANLTLYIWNSSYDNVLANTTKLSGMLNETEWNLTLPYDDVFLWNCLGYDTFGNYNWSVEGNYTITLDKTAPVVHLMSPANDSAVNNATQMFSCNITDNLVGVANLTLYIWNSSSSLEYVNMTNLTGNSNSTEWGFELPYEDAFLWNCKGYDVFGNYNWSVEGNYTITLDITAPTWRDNSTNVTSFTRYNDSVRFGVNWSDNNEVDYIIFSWNGSTGRMINESYLCGNASCVENVTKIVNFTRGNNICWKWYANDSAGNWNETDEWCFIVGNTPPRFNETLRNTTIYPLITYLEQVSCIDADNDTLEYYDNVSQFNISDSGLINWTPTDSDIGNISVNITCGDGLANASQVYMLIVDFGLRIDIINPENGTTLDYSYNVPFNFTTNRAANCSYSLDNGEHVHLKNITGYDTALDFNLNKWYNISVNCTSGFFNRTETTTFRINDITPPDITATSPNGTVYTTTVTLNATTDEYAACRYIPFTEGNISTDYIDMPYNFSGNETSHNKTLKLSNGYYEFYARCIDNVGNVMTESANISFTVDVPIIIITVPVPSGGGGGRGRVGEKLVLLVIDAPSNETLFSGNDVDILITLENKGELKLNGIFLSTETNAPNTTAILSGDYFGMLGINEKGQLRLNIRSLVDPKARIGRNRYYVNISASVVDPVYDTSMRFFFDIEEKNYETRMESLEQIQFAEDLFREHPECLELNEIIKQAQDAYDDYDYDGAISLIDSAIRACMGLIAFEEERIEEPAPKRKAGPVIFIIEMIILLALMSAMIYYYKMRKGVEVIERKTKSNLELGFEELAKEMKKSIRFRNTVNAQKNYSELYSLYKMVKSSSLPVSVKDEYTRMLSGLYSKLSKIVRK